MLQGAIRDTPPNPSSLKTCGPSMTSDPSDSDLDDFIPFDNVSFDDLMELHERDLSRLRYRWDIAQVFLAELRAVTLGRPFEATHRMWYSNIERQKELAAAVEAWPDRLGAEDGAFRGLASTPGLLAQLRPHYLEGQTLNPALAARRRLTFEERFGTTGRLGPEDIHHLQRETLRRMPPLAIAYPSEDDAPAPNPAALLEEVHQALDERLRYADRLCRDLRICAGAAPAALRSFVPRDEPVRARAFVDILLLGPNCSLLDDKDHPDPTFSTPAYTARRARAYVALHAATPDPQTPFNTVANVTRTLGVRPAGHEA
jgi:hypothetical protein